MFWFGEILLPAISEIVFTALMTLAAYAVYGRLLPFDAALLTFAVWFGGFFLLYCGYLPAKLNLWRKFRRLPRESRTRETADAMLRAELARQSGVWKTRLEKLRRR